MATTTIKPNLLARLVMTLKQRKSRDPMDTNFERRTWEGDSSNVGKYMIDLVVNLAILSILITALSMVAYVIFSPVSAAMKSATVTGVELVAVVIWVMWNGLTIPRRQKMFDEMHDHLDLISDQLRSADGRVDTVVSVEPRTFADEDVINWAVDAMRDAAPERLKELRAGYAAVVDMLDARLAA